LTLDNIFVSVVRRTKSEERGGGFPLRYTKKGPTALLFLKKYLLPSFRGKQTAVSHLGVAFRDRPPDKWITQKSSICELWAARGAQLCASETSILIAHRPTPWLPLRFTPYSLFSRSFLFISLTRCRFAAVKRQPLNAAIHAALWMEIEQGN
jgi:hypothetical protein